MDIRKIAILFLIIGAAIQVGAEERVLRMSLIEAEDYFDDHNLLLLAEHYEISKADAAILQAKLYDNPVFSFEQNIYNRINGRYFDFGPEGETAIEVEQLIYLAGQRNKRVKLERINKEMTLYQFEEVARTLRSELKQQFVELYFARKSRSIYDKQITSLTELLKVYHQQQQKGNLSLLDKSRIEALLLSLQKELNELDNQIISLQETVKLLIGLKGEVTFFPLLDEKMFRTISLDEISFAQLLESVYGRPDIQLAQTEIKAAQADVRLQRSLAFPEFKIVGKYDKAGSFINDYWAVGFSISLPIFNRNQGNIKAAKLCVEQNRQKELYVRQKAESELYAGYLRMQKAWMLYQKTDTSLEADFSAILEGVNRNFQTHNINLLEFIDYYETYKTACLQLNQIKQELFQAIENMNIITGQNIFKY